MTENLRCHDCLTNSDPTRRDATTMLEGTALCTDCARRRAGVDPLPPPPPPQASYGQSYDREEF